MFPTYKFTLFAIVVLVFIIGGIIKEYPQRVEAQRRLKDLKTRLEELERQNAELERKLGYFQSDAYLEKEARLKFNLKKEGEELVLIEKDVKETQTLEQVEKTKSLAQRIQHTFAQIWKFLTFK
jgi:cell division protein FtsB